ncbi:hypothetical protein MA16_Dca000289 [Dendrobium catenatum]|uniref:Uncharacterized protein n=1 Tax=Dendrobium catenatum TaxID=906689 RepID=A0A2I0WP96_9ASPA|nr:hypothetical protein MA16_Dca019111 [Dendrobium catenatum]PKU78945.1 hypothetical protein MA16_Dca000289 [Dendrobium catenatum]
MLKLPIRPGSQSWRRVRAKGEVGRGRRLDREQRRGARVKLDRKWRRVGIRSARSSDKARDPTGKEDSTLGFR